MARVNKGVLRDKVGNLVFKVRNGKTLVSKAPRSNKNGSLSSGKINSRKKFSSRTSTAKNYKAIRKWNAYITLLLVRCNQHIIFRYVISVIHRKY